MIRLTLIIWLALCNLAIAQVGQIPGWPPNKPSTTVVTTTWNPSDKAAGTTLSNGDLTLVRSSGTTAGARGTISKSSPTKVYYEVTLGGTVAGTTGSVGAALSGASLTNYAGSSASSKGIVCSSGGAWFINGTATTSVTCTTGQIIGVAINGTNIYVSINGTFYNSSGASTGATPSGAIGTLSGSVFPFSTSAGSAETFTINTTGSFSNLPSGYSAWN